MRNTLLTPIAILLAGAMVAGAMVFSAGEVLDEVHRSSDAQLAASQAQLAAYQAQIAQTQAAAAAAQPPPPQPVDAAKVATAGEPFMGAADAPVVMAYWFDYQCPFCQRIEETIMPLLVTDYVTPGTLKVVFKDYTFLGPDSQSAAHAARAVWDVAPDKFYAWHKAMFDMQDAENGGWGTEADIIALTRTIDGIDADKVAALMKSKAADYDMQMQSDGYEGSTMGVSGTPGSIIGKQLILGAQPYAQFKAAIETALAAANESKPAVAAPATTGTVQ